MIQVAYDISVLGQGYNNPKARTGIYRVVESLFLELVRRSDIDLHSLALNNLSNIWDITNAQLYLIDRPPILPYHPHYSSRLHLEPIYRNLARIQKSLIALSLQKAPWLYKPSIALQIPVKLFSKLDIVDRFSPSEFPIYHSPFYGFPNREVTGDLARVLTIYDLLPILSPENFTETIKNKFQRIVNSIDLDHDWITCISEHTKQDFCNYTGMNPDRVFVTHLAAAEHFHPVLDSQIITDTLQKYRIPATPYLLSLCTLEPRKNLSFLIRCFTKIILDNQTLDLNLVLVGVSGWKNNDIFQAARENPILRSRILFTGYIPDEDLSAIYSGATAFVYPSLYEGFGLPPLEAMQCGTPVITSNTSSLPEVVGDAGIQIDPKDEDALCQAIIELLNNSELRKTLSKKGIDRSRKFSWSKCADETLKVYRTAIDFH
jgi:glycosyltransferase involved in cell wall biosynthesis